MKKRVTANPVQKAYARGYRAGLKSNRRRHLIVITALERQIANWRYQALIDDIAKSKGEPTPEAIPDSESSSGVD